MLFPPTNRSPTLARVVVTGVGIVTALGRGWRTHTEAFRVGASAFRHVTLFDVSRQRAKIAAELDLPPDLPPTRLSEKRLRRLDRATRILLLAAHQAWEQAGWASEVQPYRMPVVLGTTSGGMTLGEYYLRQATQCPGSYRRQATRVMNYQAQRQGLDLCDALDFEGTLVIISNACASGANAIGHAWEILRHGRAQRALTGGYDALCQLTFAGFDSLQALSPAPCRPFDAQRDGLSLGEGAAVLTLETLESAQRRDAEIIGEIIGYGAVTDIHHLAQPHPQGEAALAAMKAACTCAGVVPEQVDYVNAHGTATPQNDVTEAEAINRWAGARAATLPVSSTKASIGHLLGAAGAVEAAVCLMALRERWLPPQKLLTTPDPICRFPIVCGPSNANLEIALSNSFGFGGANATLAFRRWR